MTNESNNEIKHEMYKQRNDELNQEHEEGANNATTEERTNGRQTWVK